MAATDGAVDMVTNESNESFAFYTMVAGFAMMILGARNSPFSHEREKGAGGTTERKTDD